MRRDATVRWVENVPTAGARALHLGELWAYRELVWFLALRDVRARYKQAVFGLLWAVLQPVAGALVFTLVFRRLADVPSDGIPYPVFALSGFLVWSYFSSSLNNATHSLVNNATLVTKVYFPRLAAPLAALIPGMVDFGAGLAILAPLLALYGVAPTGAVVTLPLWLVAAMVVALGAGLLLATLNVRYRDVHSIYGLLVQVWLFVTPVAYPSSLVPDDWRFAYALNPMVGVIDGFRWSLLDGPAPGGDLAVSAASAALLLCAGVVYFQRTERTFADVI